MTPTDDPSPSELAPLEELQAVLELREPERELVVLLPGHEPELARDALAGLLRQVAELLDAGAQLRRQLVDELPEREGTLGELANALPFLARRSAAGQGREVSGRGHEGACCAAAGGARASLRRCCPTLQGCCPSRPRRRRHPGARPGSGRASAEPPRAPRPRAAGRRPSRHRRAELSSRRRAYSGSRSLSTATSGAAMKMDE